MKRAWFSLIFSAGILVCGIHVGTSLGRDTPETVVCMTFLGFMIVITNLYNIIKEKGLMNMPERRIYKLHMPCPNCQKDEGIRLDLTGGEIRVLCVLCEEIDVTLEDRHLAKLVSGLTRLASEQDRVTSATIQDFVAEMLKLPEFVDEEEEEEDEEE